MPTHLKRIFLLSLPLVSLALLLLSPSSHAATESIRIIRQDCTGYSNCYTSLSQWEAAEQRDLTATDEIATARIEGPWTSPDTTAVTIDGWTTGPNNYINIYTATDARHDGKWNTGKYRLEVANQYAVLQIKNSYVRVDGLQINVTSSSVYNAHGVNVGSVSSLTDVRISNNIIKYSGSGNTSFNGIADGCSGCVINTNDTIWNNIIYGFNYGIYFAGATNFAYNNTIGNCHASSANKIGITSADYNNRPTIKNNIVQGCADGYSGTFNASSNYNLSDIASDASGANSKNSTIVSFVDSANKNFHLSSSDTSAKDSGINLSTDAVLAFTTDIDGETRSGSWDIGADEVSGGAPADTQTPSVPAGLSATAISSSQINLSWTISTDDTAVTGYKIYRNGTQINTFTINSYSDTGLSAATVYTYTVSAYDAAGNNSAQSSSAQATTQSTTDTTPPTRSAGSPSGSLTAGTTQTTISLTTDENATCKYSATANTSYASMASTFTTTGTTNHSTTITGLTNGTTYNYYVRCQDSSTNANTTDYTISFSVSAASTGTPSISSASGTFTNNSSLTLSGSNFGVKAQAKPMVWADFESGATDPSTLGRYTAWTRLTELAITNQGQDTNSTYAVRGIVNDGTGSSKNNSMIINQNPGITKIYTFVRRKYDDANWWNNMANQFVNYKFFRLWTNPVGYASVLPDSFFSYNFTDTVLRFTSEGSCEAVDDTDWGTGNSLPAVQTWLREEYQVSRGNGNGIAKMWSNGNLVRNLSNLYTASGSCNPSPYTDSWISTSIENFWSLVPPPQGAYVYFDDVYIDDTWARVMIGDQPTFDASTHKEIQIPSSWSSSSITFTANQGTFTNGQTAYLYVVDENGNVNASGYPIVIGQSTQSGPPVISSVSGTLINNSSVTLTGSSFGAKTNASPYRWDPVEGVNAYSGLVNNDVIPASSGGYWDHNPSSVYHYNNDAISQRGVSAANLETDESVSINKKIGATLPDANFNRETYISYWIYHSTSLTSADNVKTIRFWKANNDQTTTFTVNSSWAANGPWTAFKYDGYGVSTPSYCGSSSGALGKTILSESDRFVRPIGGEWERVEFYLKQESIPDGSNDGKYWLSQIADGGIHSYSQNNIDETCAGITSRLRWMTFGYENNTGLNTSVRLDDIYIDSTQARIELGNASTWSANTHREIQIPSAWSSNSITFTANQGTFTSGQTAYLYVIDESGNVNTNGYPITIGSGGGGDTQTPSTPTALSATALSSSQISLAWTASTDNTGVTGYRIYRGGTELTTTTTTTYSDTNLTVSTLYSYTVAAVDGAGNVSSQSSQASATTQAPPDTTAPTISGTSVTTTTTSATLSFTTNEPSDTKIEYGLTTSYGSNTTLDTTLVTSHTQTLSSLSANTTYHYRIITKDAAQNTATSQDYTFQTQSVADTTPPSAVTDLSIFNISQTSLTLSWTVPSDTSGIQSYDIRYATTPITATTFSSATQVSTIPIPATQGTTQTQYVSVGLIPGTTYSFALTSKDSLNNVSALSNVPEATTLSAPSTTSTTPSTQTGTYSAPSSGGGGGYIIYQLADATAPKTPASFTAHATDRQIALAWKNPTDTDFVRVKILRNTASYATSSTAGTVIYEGTAELFTDTGLMNDQIYYYSLYAYDGIPNYSAPTTLTATPNAALTQTSISYAAIDPGCTSTSTYSTTTGALCTKVPTAFRPYYVFSNDRVITYGMKDSTDVRELQKILQYEGLLPLTPPADGIFLAATKTAVIKFQEKYSITPALGTVGPKTKAKLNELYGTTSSTTFYRNLTIGSKGEDVKKLQQYLNSDSTTMIATTGAGSPGQETTYFGQATKAAVIKFQKKHGITPAVGYVGTLTRGKLEGK